MDTQPYQVPAHFGVPNLTPNGVLDTRTNFSPVEYRVTFANNLGVPAVVMMRNGLKFVLPSERNLNAAFFTIRVHITIKSDVYASVVQSLADAAAGNSPELEILREAFRISVEGNIYKGGTLTLDYDLTLDQLNQLGGTVYYHEVDYVVSLDTTNPTIHHPYSEEGRRNQVLMECPITEMGQSFGYSVKMVDNQNRYGPLYINISNQVYKIIPVRDVSKHDGIYITSNHSMSSKGGNGEYETRRFDFENAFENLGLWRSYDEALHGGDKTMAAKENLAKAQQEVERLKAERQKLDEKNAIEKGQQEAAMREREVELQREREAIAREREQRELEETRRRQELKDHYEERSYMRKDTSEGLKFLPALLIGLGALFGALRLGGAG